MAEDRMQILKDTEFACGFGAEWSYGKSYSIDSSRKKGFVTDYQKIPFPNQGFYRAIHIPIFPYVMAWNAWTLPLDRPTVFGFVDPAETSFILKHQAYFWSTRFLHSSHDSSSLICGT